MRLIALILIAINSPLIMAGSCGGKIPNPITDVCWSCIFPMNIAGAMEINTGERRNFDPPPPSYCTCPAPPPIFTRIGFGLSFWEMSRFVEVVREPFCSPTLGGEKLADTSNLWAGTHDDSKESETAYSFYHVHIFTAPIMDWVGTVIGSALCMSDSTSLDVMFMSELDPIWNDDETSLLLSPEALLFNNPATILSCAADAVSATVSGFGIDALFWCAGSQGTVYPLNGNTPAHYSGLNSALGNMHKGMTLMHRLFLGRDTSTPAAMCGGVPQPVIRKTQYKYNVMWPIALNQRAFGFGGQTWWGVGQEFPYEGEDYNFLLFRKRTCCAL